MPTIAQATPTESENPDQPAVSNTLIGIAYTRLDSPFGELLVASTEVGLVAVGLPEQDPNQLLNELASGLSAQLHERADRLEAPCRQLTEYFEGKRRKFDLDLDRRLARGFQVKALDAIAAVPYGQTATYAEIATAAGSPRAYRAAGTSCARNPLPIVIPCHRILATGGGLGGYGGGLAMKQALLDMEIAETSR